jgi:hypothetical protein
MPIFDFGLIFAAGFTAGFDLFILIMLADGLAGTTGFFAAGLEVAVPVIFVFFCPYIGIIYFPCSLIYPLPIKQWQRLVYGSLQLLLSWDPLGLFHYVGFRV